MPGQKIENVQQVLHWFDRGLTPTEVQVLYQATYHVEATPEAFLNIFKRARSEAPGGGYPQNPLLPWKLAPRHRGDTIAQRLRTEWRRRRGLPVDPAKARDLDSWLSWMKASDLVVDYDPESDEGFAFLPRRPGVDGDLIYEPDQPYRRGEDVG